jgi:hypothetical protein
MTTIKQVDSKMSRWSWEVMCPDVFCNVLTYLTISDGCILVGLAVCDDLQRQIIIGLMLHCKSSQMPVIKPIASIIHLYSCSRWEKIFLNNRCNLMIPNTCVMCLQNLPARRLQICHKTGVVLCLDCRRENFILSSDLSGLLAIPSQKLDDSISLEFGYNSRKQY